MKVENRGLVVCSMGRKSIFILNEIKVKEITSNSKSEFLCLYERDRYV